MGIMKEKMLRENEEEREEERQRAICDSPIGEAWECTRCGTWFPATDDGGLICDSCWDYITSRD